MGDMKTSLVDGGGVKMSDLGTSSLFYELMCCSKTYKDEQRS